MRSARNDLARGPGSETEGSTSPEAGKEGEAKMERMEVRKVTTDEFMANEVGGGRYAVKIPEDTIFRVLEIDGSRVTFAVGDMRYWTFAANVERHTAKSE